MLPTDVLDKLFKKVPIFLVATLSLVLIAALGLADYFTGFEFSFSIFYVIPIVFATWYAGSVIGGSMTMAAGIAWLAADIGTGHPYSHPGFVAWNTLVRLSFFMITSLLVRQFKEKLAQKERFAKTCPLTGAYNSRAFYELAKMEINRFKRYRRPFTLAYIDLDNFKTVNDTLGHDTGNRVLRIVVQTLKQSLRQTDLAARLGGDEFAVLLPETGFEPSKDVLDKLRKQLLARMQDQNWLVTFSIGSVTFMEAPSSVSEMIKAADNVMYAVKKTGKDGVIHEMWRGQTAGSPML